MKRANQRTCKPLDDLSNTAIVVARIISRRRGEWFGMRSDSPNLNAVMELSANGWPIEVIQTAECINLRCLLPRRRA